MQTIRTLIMSLFVASMMVAGPGLAQDAPMTEAEQLAADREAARIDRVWNRLWREFAPFYIQHEEAYICVPGYDRRLPSSMGMSARDYTEESAKEVEYTDERGRERTRVLTKPEDEANAVVRAIPSIAVGQYGYIHSGMIRSVEDDQTVEINQVWLLDAEAATEERKEALDGVVRDGLGDIEDAVRNRGRNERRNRGDGIIARRGAEREAIMWMYEDRQALAERQRNRSFSRYQWTIVGYRTGQLNEGLRWPAGRAAEDGLQLVIVEVAGANVTAVPAQRIGSGLSELEFLNCLEARGITKAEFVELVTEAKRVDRTGYADAVLDHLEGHESTDESETEGNDTVELAD